jgi:hypothetical protein
MSEIAASSRDDDARRDAILNQLRELEDRAMWSAQGQFEQAKHWQSMNLWLGSVSAVAAAVSGALVLAQSGLDLLGGGLALLAAGGGAILTTVNASQRATKASSAANAYLEIQTSAKRSQSVDVPWAPLDEARQMLQGLAERMDEQNKAAEPISPRAYRRARKNIRSGGQQTDEG